VEYLLTAGLLAAVNATPLPMPPSWVIVAYLSVQLDVDPVGIVVAAAAGAALGRTILAAWTRALGPRLMSADGRENIAYLGGRLRGRRSTWGVASVLAVSPPPSGALYTAAGVLRVNLPLVFGACLVGRLVTFGLGVAVAGAAADELAGRLRDWAGPAPIALGLVALVAALWLLGRIDWRATIARRRPALRVRGGRTASPGADPAPRG
jgi:membrane protein YqaA with SNARE-associated domain